MPKKTRPMNPTGTSKMIVNAMKQGQRPAARMSEMMVGGLASNAATAVAFSKMFEALDLGECVAALVTATESVKGGDLAGLEATLTAQVVTLNAMFTQLAHQSSTMANAEQIDRYTRLALEAQGQCRATVETLALMRNPPMVFAKQANIAHGPQHVNNGTPPASLSAPSSCAGNQKSEPIKLLEAAGERMDFGTTNTAGGGDQAMAPVGTVNRATNR
jgi:hypothetical protein